MARKESKSAGSWARRGTDEELRELAGPLRALGSEVEQAFVFFNNNGRSDDGSGGWISQAATNAAQLPALLTN